MARLVQFTIVLFTIAGLPACALFDSGIEWRDGPYALTWIDLPDEVALSYDMGRGSWAGVVEPRVFAVGANDRYVVVQQHPGGDRSVTNFFIVDKREDVLKRPKVAIIGPLTAEQFRDKAANLKVPPFTKILESLK
jgi:hypothetical protein